MVAVKNAASVAVPWLSHEIGKLCHFPACCLLWIAVCYNFHVPSVGHWESISDVITCENLQLEAEQRNRTAFFTAPTLLSLCCLLFGTDFHSDTGNGFSIPPLIELHSTRLHCVSGREMFLPFLFETFIKKYNFRILCLLNTINNTNKEMLMLH